MADGKIDDNERAVLLVGNIDKEAVRRVLVDIGSSDQELIGEAKKHLSLLAGVCAMVGGVDVRKDKYVPPQGNIDLSDVKILLDKREGGDVYGLEKGDFATLYYLRNKELIPRKTEKEAITDALAILVERDLLVLLYNDPNKPKFYGTEMHYFRVKNATDVAENLLNRKPAAQTG